MGKYTHQISEERLEKVLHFLENETHIDTSRSVIATAKIDALIDALEDQGVISGDDVEQRSNVILHDAFKETE